MISQVETLTSTATGEMSRTCPRTAVITCLKVCLLWSTCRPRISGNWFVMMRSAAQVT